MFLLNSWEGQECLALSFTNIVQMYIQTIINVIDD